jgi:hypothetical protein
MILRSRLQIPHPLRRCLVIFLLTQAWSMCQAVPVAYQFKVGHTYLYRVSASTQSNCAANDLRQTTIATAATEVQIRPLRFRDGVYVLDIRSADFQGRRYLRPDGTVIAAPGEASDQLPFLLVFPSGDWQVGTTHRQSQPITIGKQSYQASWEITLKDLNKEGTQAGIVFSGAIRHPEDRAIQRKISLSGTISMDLAQGIPKEGQWTVQYGLLYSIKELAVTRTLWKLQETTTIRFVLEEAKRP